MNEETRLVMVNRKSLVHINPETVEDIIHISDDDVKWLKVNEVGFLDNDSLFSEQLQGIIFGMKPYWIHWEPGLPPEKIPFTAMEQQPDGFELRLDLKVLLADGEIIGLSLAPSSARSFSRYMRRLKTLGVPVSEAITKLSTKTLTNKKAQKFALVEFDYIPRNQEQKPKQEEEEYHPCHCQEPPVPVEALDDIRF